MLLLKQYLSPQSYDLYLRSNYPPRYFLPKTNFMEWKLWDFFVSKSCTESSNELGLYSNICHYGKLSAGIRFSFGVRIFPNILHSRRNSEQNCVVFGSSFHSTENFCKSGCNCEKIRCLLMLSISYLHRIHVDRFFLALNIKKFQIKRIHFCTFTNYNVHIINRYFGRRMTVHGYINWSFQPITKYRMNYTNTNSSTKN